MLKLPRTVVASLPEIEDEIAKVARPPDQYLPPHRRTQELGELTVSGVKSFAELPTSQIDNLIEAVEIRLTKIKEKAEAIKADYKRRTDELTSEINRLNEACVKSENKLGELHSQLDELYQPNKPRPIPHNEEPTP